MYDQGIQLCEQWINVEESYVIKCYQIIFLFLLSNLIGIGLGKMLTDP